MAEMSYEKSMLTKYRMPLKIDVEKTLLIALFNHNGVIKEFGEDEEIVNKIAFEFELNEQQLGAKLETIYKKENRLKRSSLWHRLLFRAADELAKRSFVTRPKETVKLTKVREWMLTEKGYDYTLNLLGLSEKAKDYYSVKSFEVEVEANQIIQAERPMSYIPIEEKTRVETSKFISIRTRGFRSAVVETYDYSCAVCGLKLPSPNYKIWEVQAAHIVPHHAKGKDDLLNGIALCRLHHWAFDMGWFSITNDFHLIISPVWSKMPEDYGRISGSMLIFKENHRISLPKESKAYPHPSALDWHRNNVFAKR